MNIEDERKAFEEHCKAQKLATFVVVKWNGSGYVSKYSNRPFQQAMFEIWLAAKRHVAEMNKPVCEVYHLTTGWAVDPICSDHHEGFESKEEALTWAKDNGFRVITE